MLIVIIGIGRTRREREGGVKSNPIDHHVLTVPK